MKKSKVSFLLLIVLILSLAISGCVDETTDGAQDYSDKLVVHFIDVGQGDSTFIQFPNGETSLIDGGTKKDGDKVVNYLKKLNITNIDYLISTHPHEDHIGGLPEVIRNFSIGKVYMPDITANTHIFEELLKEIQNRDLKIDLSKAGDLLIDQKGLKFITLAPNIDDYSNTNDFSIVTKIEYMDNSFLITGDAEKASEVDMINGKYNLKSNVLKVGHHGGRTSSNKEFLEKVYPDYSIISLGKDNTYGHPHEETINRLHEVGTKIMRTDELGNIVIVSDGKSLTFPDDVVTEPLKESTQSQEKNSKNYYIGNKNTKVYHSKNCGLLPKEGNQIIFDSIEEAEDSGYKPHKNCFK